MAARSVARPSGAAGRRSLPNGLPAVCYGQWSPTYATTNPGWAGGKLQLRAALWSAPIAIKVVRPTFRISRG